MIQIEAINIKIDIESKKLNAYLVNKEEFILTPSGSESNFEIFGDELNPSILYGGFITNELSIKFL